MDSKEKEQSFDPTMTNEEEVSENENVNNDSIITNEEKVNENGEVNNDSTMTNEEKVNKNGGINSKVIRFKESKGKRKLKHWLNRHLRIKMTDGRILTGSFLCTDRDANVILGLCSEYLSDNSESRSLGLVMVPGRHIVTMHLDEPK